MVHFRAEASSHDVAEIQGLYGAFSFPEKLLQKIWLRRDFELAGARTCDGQRVSIIDPGKWNLLGGPDFRGARIRFDDGRDLVGDVELHLRATDWDAHRHAKDPAYSNVVLHVVLFWPDAGYQTINGVGATIPILPLLPLLHHDLEEYATDDAVELLTDRPTARLTNDLALFPPRELRAALALHATGRWRQKVHFALLRVRRLGWESACHVAAMETLGFRFNRAPMLRIATRWPLGRWREDLDLGEVLESERGAWSLQGVRPANHPRRRLAQYRAWVLHDATWPGALANWGEGLFAIGESAATRATRRDFSFVGLRDRVWHTVCGDAVGGSRLDTLVCDAFLPLLATRMPESVLRGYWMHWFSGDVPPFVNAGLRQLGVYDGRGQPSCHGLAQGLLGWLIEREVGR